MKFSDSAMERIIESINFRNNTSTLISVSTGITYAMVVNVMKTIEITGVINKEKKNKERKKIITLTEKGEKIQKLIKNLRSYNENTRKD